jgi:predicted RNA-binding protein with PIN domain
MPRTGPDPLAETDLLIVDGTNLLHALRRGSSALPAASLIGRLRAIIPAVTAIELVFDGTPERGMRRERVASGLTVHYAAPMSADAAILSRAGRLDATASDRLLVVTDDRDLRTSLERRGARTARSSWLLGRLQRQTLVSPSAGNPRPPASAATGSGAARPLQEDKDEADGPGWQPGRGATAKRGNGRRSPRPARHP